MNKHDAQYLNFVKRLFSRTDFVQFVLRQVSHCMIGPISFHHKQVAAILQKDIQYYAYYRCRRHRRWHEISRASRLQHYLLCGSGHLDVFRFSIGSVAPWGGIEMNKVGDEHIDQESHAMKVISQDNHVAENGISTWTWSIPLSWTNSNFSSVADMKSN